jgi:hypothetical protein
LQKQRCDSSRHCQDGRAFDRRQGRDTSGATRGDHADIAVRNPHEAVWEAAGLTDLRGRGRLSLHNVRPRYRSRSLVWYPPVVEVTSPTHAPD